MSNFVEPAKEFPHGSIGPGEFSPAFGLSHLVEAPGSLNQSPSRTHLPSGPTCHRVSSSTLRDGQRPSSFHHLRNLALSRLLAREARHSRSTLGSGGW